MHTTLGVFTDGFSRFVSLRLANQGSHPTFCPISKQQPLDKLVRPGAGLGGQLLGRTLIIGDRDVAPHVGVGRHGDTASGVLSYDGQSAHIGVEMTGAMKIIVIDAARSRLIFATAM